MKKWYTMIIRVNVYAFGLLYRIFCSGVLAHEWDSISNVSVIFNPPGKY